MLDCKRALVAIALAIVMACEARAAEQRLLSDSDSCFNEALELAETAERKNLPDATLDSIEDLLTRMESYCAARQFSEAMAVGGEIEQIITPRK
jgi:hypothetical protein